MRRVLVVDDESLVSMMLADWLAEMGCEAVGPASSVSEALRLIRSSPCDAAVLDVSLRGERSYPVADELRERRIPYTFATGYGDDSILGSYTDAPVLTKPFAFALFQQTVEALLNA